MLTYITIIVSA